MLDYNLKTFGRVAIGVHGKELPKFSEEEPSKQWWKLKKGFNSNPKYQSSKLLKQEQKFWSKNDQMYLADTKDEPAPVDPFKTMHFTKTKKNDIVEKVNQVTYYTPNTVEAEHDGPGRKTMTNYKWTTIENQFCRKKKRLFDELP